VMGRRERRRRSLARQPLEVAVDIERLILHGLGILDRDVVGRVLELNLGQRLAAASDGAPARGGAVDVVRTQTILGPSAPDSSALAVGIGGAVAAVVRAGLAGHE